jgi:hypothetical protein
MEREFDLQYHMGFNIAEQRNMDVRILNWHYSKLVEQRRSEKEME